jgi:hypothetical protein
LQRQDGEEAFRGNGKRTAVEDEIWRLKQKNKALPLFPLYFPPLFLSHTARMVFVTK